MKRRLLTVGMSAALGITLVAAPATALNQNACDGIAAAVRSQPGGLQGLGQRIGAHLDEVSKAIGGDVGPDKDLLVPGVRYVDGGLCGINKMWQLARPARGGPLLIRGGGGDRSRSSVRVRSQGRTHDGVVTRTSTPSPDGAHHDDRR